MCDVVDVSWLTAGQEVELEFTWGSAKGPLRPCGKTNALTLGGTVVRTFLGTAGGDVVRVVSPAPPVTPAAEEWAEGDLAWVTWNGETVLRWHANYGNSPRWWRIDRWNTGLPHDSPGIKSIVRAVVCPPGLTPVDLDELAEKVKRDEWHGLIGVGEVMAHIAASYRRSGSAER